MLPVLAIAADGEIRITQAAETLAKRLSLSEGEREEMLPSGKQRLLHNRAPVATDEMAAA